ncbi:glycosyltransferase family 4 protein [Tautonia plasticadhaerens]|uniref:Glycosyl transferases group 1 n=1 Tax=Tautonia plasticadhaerens TaxID=2527974 RepID=A0A518H5Y2_9BACT|nr:glycosyltransferase family 4 protein [Tautonia plasticadhaerens]QDV36247.1 Glycosyl transferases group 1 [Tautonia plasticadhaerens]
MICTRLPKEGYSGGRYHAWVMGEVLAAAGHEVTFWTNARPAFADDFAGQHRLGSIRLSLTPDFGNPPVGPFDLVVVVPDLYGDRLVSHGALLLARRDASRVALLNFESPNWFNAHSPEPRDPALWDPAVEVGCWADLILSLTAIGNEFARAYYVDAARTALFRHCYPAINSTVADAVGDIPKRDQVICLTRFVRGDSHKGAGELVHALGPEMRGMTFLLVVGRGDVDEAIMGPLKIRAEAIGARIELAWGLNDAEKFRRIKQSRAMLFLSYFEGFGYPPVEAQYCGVPCVSYDLPVLREVSGDALVYVPPGAHDALPGALAEAFAWPAQRCEALRERIAHVARLEALASRIDSIVREVVDLPGPPAVRSAPRAAVRSWRRRPRPARPALRGLVRRFKTGLRSTWHRPAGQGSG